MKRNLKKTIFKVKQECFSKSQLAVLFFGLLFSLVIMLSGVVDLAQRKLQEKRGALTPESLVGEQVPLGFDFNGLRNDYATWVRDNLVIDKNGRLMGPFTINDDDGMCSTLANDAFLYLMYSDASAKDRYRFQLFHLKDINYNFPENGQRQFADVLEIYIAMRERGVFINPGDPGNLSEESDLENWFKERTYYLYDSEDRRRGAQYQAVGAGMAAVAGYVLKTTRTGNDYEDNIRDFWRYAKTANSFNDEPDGWSTHVNSAHYVSYVAMSMLRVGIYVNNDNIDFPNPGGWIMSDHKANFAKLIEWIIKTYPHNGNSLAYGVTWGRDHLRPLFNVLLAGSYYLQGYDDELAKNSKWLANQMFRYSLNNNQETYWTNNPVGRFEANPIYVWWYLNDLQSEQMPSVNRFSSAFIQRYIAQDSAGWDYAVGADHLMNDKIVHRSGWDDQSFYFQVEMAPTNHKGRPYANSITQIVYGNEVFSTDHTNEDNDWKESWWQERNVAYVPGWVFAKIAFNAYSDPVNYPEHFINNATYSESRSYIFNWERKVRLNKSGDKRVEVTDTLPANGQVYWHFQGNPTWKDDNSGVVLEKNGTVLEVTWNGNATHRLVDTYTGDRYNDFEWGYTGLKEYEVVLSGRSDYTTVFRPAGPPDCSNMLILPSTSFTQGEVITLEAQVIFKSSYRYVDFYIAPVGSDYCDANNWTFIGDAFMFPDPDNWYSMDWDTSLPPFGETEPVAPGEYMLIAKPIDTAGNYCTGNPSALACGLEPCSDCSQIIEVFPKPVINQLTSPSIEAGDSINVGWLPVEVAESYGIQRRLVGEANWTQVVANLDPGIIEYTDTSETASHCGEHEYRLVVNRTGLPSAYSEPVSITQ
ncbi:hypothetical protein ACFL0Y_03630, partial [Patescibacteria group bacterium]